MPAFRWTAVEIVAVEKLRLGVKMVLRQRFDIGLEPLLRDGISAQSIEALFGRLAGSRLNGAIGRGKSLTFRDRFCGTVD